MKKKLMKRWFTLLLAILTTLPMLLSAMLPAVAEENTEDKLDLIPYMGIIKLVSSEIRMNTPGGIRFVSKVDAAKFAELRTFVRGSAAVTDMKIGTIIAPLAYVEQAGGKLTFDALDQLPHGVNYAKVESKVNQWYENDTDEDGYYEFAGSLYNIKPGHYNERFVGAGYIEFLMADGTSKYLYGSYSRTGVSISDLSAKKLEELENPEQKVLDYLTEYKVTPIDYTVMSMDNVYQVGNRLYFTVGDTDVYLTYTGDYGWRIKAHHADRICAEQLGAAQAMSYYLGEDYADKALPITVSKPDNDTLRVTSPDGTYVDFGARVFSMNFYSPIGTQVATVTSIVADGSKVTVQGVLAANEGVYGGGERLDTVNKRGTTMDLYTCDGWNNSATTYMVVPLFATTRGAGIYVNRYERMIADFGKTNSNLWSIKLENELTDFYIYSSGDMKDVIEGYTKLSGAAAVPEEWAYGVMLCRYGSDLTTFDGQNAYENAADIPTINNLLASSKGQKLLDWLAAGNKPRHKQLFYEGSTVKYIYIKDEQYPNGAYVVANKDNAPSGRSVKELVNKMIAAGMKPSAVIMEAWSYSSFDVPKKEELRQTCEWLDSLGIRAMLYMRVASTIHGGMPGYQSKYKLNAWVTTNGETKYTTKIPDVAYDGKNPDVGKLGSLSHEYLDITDPAAMNWYLDMVWGELVELGVDGVKIDFCETFPDEGKTYGSGEAQTTVKYDWHDPSKIVSGSEHHAYPTYFITAFFDRMNEIKKELGMDDGFFVLSRGGGIGSQRNPYIWAGDQVRDFGKLDDQIMAVLTSGLSGVPFMSYDMAGYRYGGQGTTYNNSSSLEYESGVFARAIAFTVFMPNIQTHGTVRNAYELLPEAQTIYKNFLALREELLPYLNKLVEEACTSGLPIARHPVLHYQNDTNVYNLKTQFMMGDGLMLAPILNATDTSVKVYLPKGSWTNLLTGETISVGDGGKTVTAYANFGQIPVFLNNDSADADMLREIFASDAWNVIKNYVQQYAT